MSLARRSAIAILLISVAGTAWTAPRSSVAARRADAAVDAAVSAADRKAIERVIRDQLDAFGRDDARRAFAHASPDIQRAFRTPGNFMRMVHDNYQPVYRADSVRFIRLELVDKQWMQTIQLVDEEGHVWRALFTMKRLSGRTWKVGGCQLVPTSAITT